MRMKHEQLNVSLAKICCLQCILPGQTTIMLQMHYAIAQSSKPWKNACHVSRRRGICTDGRQRPAVSSLLMPAEPAHQEQHKTHTPNSTPRHTVPGRGPGAVTGRRFKCCTKHTELEAETLSWQRKLITTIVMLIISDWSFRFDLPATSKRSCSLVSVLYVLLRRSAVVEKGQGDVLEIPLPLQRQKQRGKSR